MVSAGRPATAVHGWLCQGERSQMQRSPGNELQPGRLLPTSQVLGASNCQQSKTTELERRNWENKCRTIAHSNRETELVLAGKRKAVLRLGRGEAQEAVTANLDRLHVVLTSTARLPASSCSGAGAQRAPRRKLQWSPSHFAATSQHKREAPEKSEPQNSPLEGRKGQNFKALTMYL